MSALDDQPAIEVRGLHKRFKTFRLENYTTIKEQLTRRALAMLGFRRSSAPDSFAALRDVSLIVPRGRSLGLIGPNGSGKSTLLRLIAGIYLPDAGEVRVRGRVAAMLALGAGLHPQFTGRENAVLYGMLMGLTQREVHRRLPAIIDFSELGEEKFAAPLRTYSSGQYLRLAFSVATQLEPDIFLIDEALAVGDAAFRAKCYAHINELRRQQNKTLVIVSHVEKDLRMVCDELVLLEDGRLSEPLAVDEGFARLAAIFRTRAPAVATGS
jgi:ABC-type polysaccharide/polyol phosphate transport system ATPase subunit